MNIPMQNHRLFDRIRKRDGSSGNPRRHSNGRQVDSIIEHLNKMLNTKQGTTLMDKNYGMPDFTELAALFPDSIRDVERTISNTIERYEPRLSQVEVHFVFQDHQSLVLCFHIQAVMTLEDEDVAVQFESSIDASGRAVIKA